MPITDISNNSNYRDITTKIDEMNQKNKTNKADETGTKKTDKSSMGKDDFLKLLVTQLTYQDPMSPMESSEMMNQMAMLGLMEQTTNMRTALDELSKSMELSKWQQGSNLIGKTVDAVNGEGKAVSGVVKEVVNYDGKMYILTDKDTFQISQIVSLRDPSLTGNGEGEKEKPKPQPIDKVDNVSNEKETKIPKEDLPPSGEKAKTDVNQAYKDIQNYLSA